jgi:hypothetical protein
LAGDIYADGQGLELLGHIADDLSLHVVAFGWSPPTPSAGLRARVAVLTDSTDAAIAQPMAAVTVGETT